MLFNYYCPLILLSATLCNIIVFPFHYINISDKNDKESFINTFVSQNIFTEVSIGTPAQKIIFNLSLKDYRFYIANNKCHNESISFYNYKNSSTYARILPSVSPFDDLSDASLVNDRISFYNDINLNSNETIDKFRFNFFRQYEFWENTNIYCGNLGLSINLENLDIEYLDEDDYMPTIFSTLKSYNSINKYSWTYEFLDKDDYIKGIYDIITNKSIIEKYAGLLIIGKYPHEYNPKPYSGHELISIYSDKKVYKSFWNFNFHKIYYNKNQTNSNDENNIVNLNEKQVALLLNLNYIMATKEYFDSIKENYFDYYINKSICLINSRKIQNNDYKIVSCNKKYFTKDEMKKFPVLYFKQSDFNYTFSLNYEDVFKENQDEIYFLIYFVESNNVLWEFGKIFLKKYHFSFNQDSSTIHFYSEYDEILSNRKNENKNNKNKETNNNADTNSILKIIIIIVLLIISLVLGIFIGKMINDKKNKKRANELEDSFEYIDTNNNVNNDMNINS